jgi:hypothetical protein
MPLNTLKKFIIEKIKGALAKHPLLGMSGGIGSAALYNININNIVPLEMFPSFSAIAHFLQFIGVTGGLFVCYFTLQIKRVEGRIKRKEEELINMKIKEHLQNKN